MDSKWKTNAYYGICLSVCNYTNTARGSIIQRTDKFHAILFTTSQTCIDGRSWNVGIFDTLEEAQAACNKLYTEKLAS